LAVGATGADAAGGRRSRGGGGGEEVGGPPEADVAKARGRDVQSLSMCRPWQWTQSRMWGAKSLVRVFVRVRVVMEATTSARAVECGDGAVAAVGRLVEDVAWASRDASWSCRTFTCRCRSVSCAVCADVEARSAIEALSLSSSALRRTDLSCSLSARTRLNCRSRRHGVLEALSSSKSAASPDWRLDLYIKIWVRSSEPSFSGKWSRNMLSVMTRSASLHSVGQN